LYIIILDDLTLNSVEPLVLKNKISEKTEIEWLPYKFKHQNCHRYNL
jgi:hypothetical protein